MQTLRETYYQMEYVKQIEINETFKRSNNTIQYIQIIHISPFRFTYRQPTRS